MCIERKIYRALAAQNKTLAAAESCTGGLVSARLVSVPGISSFFFGGVVSYTNFVKETLLSVSKDSLDAHTAVSAEVACEMADGIRRRLGTSLGVSVTGLAGPGGGTQKIPVGTVFIGLATDDGVQAFRYRFRGGRASVRRQAAKAALRAVRDALDPHNPPHNISHNN